MELQDRSRMDESFGRRRRGRKDKCCVSVVHGEVRAGRRAKTTTIVVIHLQVSHQQDIQQVLHVPGYLSLQIR